MKKCAQARRLFEPYWDGETTLAEREWFDAHLAGCEACRGEYESLARTLELAASLPRHEPAPDFAERVVARARRASPAADRVRAPEPRWVPVAAAAAVLVVGALVLVPRFVNRPDAGFAGPQAGPAEPVLVGAPAPVAPGTVRADDPVSQAPSEEFFAEAGAAMVPDSLFDHSEDIEFILDPVVVNRRGRAAVSRTPDPVETRQAVITF
jgi:anti-sigma factor RsiW